MKRNDNNKNLIGVIFETFGGFVSSLYPSVVNFINFSFVFSLSYLTAFFSKLSKFFSLISRKISSASSSNQHFDFPDAEYLVFTNFCGIYHFASTKLVRISYFFAFTFLFLSITNIELSNESLLLGSIVLAIFFLYSPVKEMLAASISSEILSIRYSLVRKLSLLSKISDYEELVLSQHKFFVELVEETVECLESFTLALAEADDSRFDQALDESFAVSLYDYFVLESREELHRDVFSVEEAFEDGVTSFLNESFE